MPAGTVHGAYDPAPAIWAQDAEVEPRDANGTADCCDVPMNGTSPMTMLVPEPLKVLDDLTQADILSLSPAATLMT